MVNFQSPNLKIYALQCTLPTNLKRFFTIALSTNHKTEQLIKVLAIYMPKRSVWNIFYNYLKFIYFYNNRFDEVEWRHR